MDITHMICTQCGVQKEINYFFIRRRVPLLYRKNCKQCISRAGKIRYVNKKEIIKRKVTEYYYKNWEIKQEKRRLWLENNKDKVAQYKKKYVKKNKERLLYIARAHDAVRNAIEKGKIKKPSACELCGREANLEAHHHNGYDIGSRLDVLFLCIKCHRKEDYLKRIKNGTKKHKNIFSFQ